MYELSPQQLEIVRTILKRHLSGREVLVCGSRATGTAKEFSDLDLVVMGDEPLTLRQRALLEQDFDESVLPFKVDVVDWASTQESFREIINNSAKPL